MATKPIVTIPVDDSAFKRFLEQFEVYSKKVSELPEEWRKLDTAMGESARTTGELKDGIEDYARSWDELG